MINIEAYKLSQEIMFNKALVHAAFSEIFWVYYRCAFN